MYIILLFCLLAIVIALFTYLIVLGANLCKTNMDITLEDEEQMGIVSDNYKKNTTMEEDIDMGIKRGEIYYAALDETYVGSEQTGVRPVVILQNNIGNEYSPTVIIAPITSKVNSKTKIPTHILINAKTSGLKRNSIILTEQIRAIDKKRLKNYVGALDTEELKTVDKALIISLGINNLDTLKKEKLNKEGLEEKTEFVTRKQIASYGVVAREFLKHSGNLEISNNDFGEYILTLINLYEPDEIEKQAERITSSQN